MPPTAAVAAAASAFRASGIRVAPLRRALVPSAACNNVLPTAATSTRRPLSRVASTAAAAAPLPAGLSFAAAAAPLPAGLSFAARPRLPPVARACCCRRLLRRCFRAGVSKNSVGATPNLTGAAPSEPDAPASITALKATFISLGKQYGLLAVVVYMLISVTNIAFLTSVLILGGKRFLEPLEKLMNSLSWLMPSMLAPKAADPAEIEDEEDEEQEWEPLPTMTLKPIIRQEYGPLLFACVINKLMLPGRLVATVALTRRASKLLQRMGFAASPATRV